MPGIYMLVPRFIHIVASFCWAGGNIIFFLFVEPTSRALAPAGTQFLQHMAGKRRFNIFMAITSSLTVLSGALLLWQRGSPNWGAYVGTGPGLLFTLGSAVGIAVYFLGFLGMMPRATRLTKLGAEIQAAGDAPNAAQRAELHKLDREMSTISRVEFVLVSASLTLMAAARYWLF